MSNRQILIVGANGAMGSHTLLKLYGNEGLSVLILPFELDVFVKDKIMTEDQWYPEDKTFIPKDAFVIGKEPASSKEIGVFTTETIPERFFRNDGTVIITSKIFHYESVLKSIKPILNDDTILFNLVNGLKPEVNLETLCAGMGIHNHVVRAIVMGGVHYTINESSFLVHSGIERFVIGNWNKAKTPEYEKELQKISQLFPKSKFIAEPRFENAFRTPCFDKILANLVNPISVFTGCITIEFVEHDLLRNIITRCFNQGIDIGMAIGLDFTDRQDIIGRKLEMYEKAGKATKAHLPSMGQDAIRAITNKTVLYHENEHIGSAIVKEGKDNSKSYYADFIDGFNQILDSVTEHYNNLFKENEDDAPKFLIELIMRNRLSLGLNPNSAPLYDQFAGLDTLESQVTIDEAEVPRINDIHEAADIFRKNFERTKNR